MLAQLGVIQFDLLTGFDSFDHCSRTMFPEHAAIEGKPKLQWIGDELQTINITVRFNVGFCDPEAEKSRLEEARAAHTPLPFIFGNGSYKGYYVIEEISERLSQTFGDGTIIGIDLDVRLKEWVKDQVITTRRARPSAARTARMRSDNYTTQTVTNRDNVSFTTIVRQGQ